MKNEENNMITYRIVAVMACAIILSVFGFFASNIYTKLLEIQKDVTKIQLSVVKVQSEMLNKEDAKEIAKNEINKWVIKNKNLTK